MASRLPTPGSDQGSWGDILNDFLSQSHTNTGTLKDNVVGANQLQDNAVTRAKTSGAIQTSLDAADNAIPASQKGVSDGVASLTGTTLTPAQIPTTVVTKSTDSNDAGKAIDAHTGTPLVVASTTQVLGAAAPRNTVAAIGDSITAACEPSGNAVGNTQPDDGYLTWANYLLYDRLDVTYIDGVVSENTQEIRARLTPFLASGAAYGCIFGGTNDLADDRTIADITGDLEYMYEQALAVGMVVLAFTILPRSDITLTTGQKAVLYGVNQWIREYVAATDGMLLVDAFGSLADYDGAPRTGMTYDSLHPSKSGARAIGTIIATLLEPRVSSVNELLHSRADLQNIVEYSPFHSTAGGTNSDPGSISGDIPIGYTLDIVSGTGTVVSSLEARADGKPGYWWKIVISSGADCELRWFRFGRASQFAIGEHGYARCEYKGEGTWTDVKELRLQYIEPGGTNYAATFWVSNTSSFLSAIPQGVMRTPTKASTTASSSARIQGLIKADAATLYIASPEIRKVV